MSGKAPGRCAVAVAVWSVTAMMGGWSATQASGQFLALPSPPDVDKQGVINNTTLEGDNSCWMATAANLLGAAGYGQGATPQLRAQDVYADMTAHFGVADKGIIEKALKWWLDSGHNVYPDNPYRYITTFGAKSTKKQWNDPNGKWQIGHELRSGNFVGLSLKWPEDKIFSGGKGGHAVTAWGDDGNLSNTSPIQKIVIADSDTDGGGNLQTYVYDDYNNGNPDGPNGSAGKGWYFNYFDGAGDHAFIRHATVLRPVAFMPNTGFGGGTKAVRQVKAQLFVVQPLALQATGLKFELDSEGAMYSYNASQDWTPLVAPISTTEMTTGNGELDRVRLEYSFADTKVPQGAGVRINASAVVGDVVSPNVPISKLHIKGAAFQYPGVDKPLLPTEFSAGVRPTHSPVTPGIEQQASGHLVIGFDVLEGPAGGVAGSFKFMQQYFAGDGDFVLEIDAIRTALSTGPLVLSGLKIGHSDGDLSDTELALFDEWLATRPGNLEVELGGTLAYRLDVDALLPRVIGEDVSLIPEPGAIGLLAPAGAVMLRRRRAR